MSYCSPLSSMKVTALTVLIIAGGAQAAQAMKRLNESGSFDCSCSGGAGTCTFVSSTDNTDCYKGPSNTCTGTCKLTLTPDKPKASILKGPAQGGAGTKLKSMQK